MNMLKQPVKILLSRGVMLFIAVLLTATVVPQILNIKSVSADDGGYPWIDAHALYAAPDYSSSYGYALPCPSKDTECDKGGSSLMGTVNGVTYGEADLWHYGLRNCTSYAAWKINQVFGVNNISGWGNAYQWDTGYINSQPYAVHNSSGYTPQVGDIAQWESHPNDTFGHVAYVWKVETNGVADLWEYNQAYDGLFTGTRTTASGSDGTPDHYIHIGVVPGSWGGVGGATYSGGDSMASGTTLLPNYYLTSANVQHVLVFQTDSNLVLYSGGGTVLWQSGTGGQNANRLVMQTDGNLVMYRANNSVVWQSGTGGHSGSYANLQSDGNFVVRDSGTVYWWTGTGGHPNLTYFGSDRLTAGQQITQSQYLRSADGTHALLLQTDGNAVLYGPGYHILWQTATAGSGDRYTMQADGNLVLYGINIARWQSATSGSNNYVVMQSDGNFVVYNSANFPLWTSGTGGKI